MEGPKNYFSLCCNKLYFLQITILMFYSNVVDNVVVVVVVVVELEHPMNKNVTFISNLCGEMQQQQQQQQHNEFSVYIIGRIFLFVEMRRWKFFNLYAAICYFIFED